MAAKRTAFGTFGGALKNVNQTQLQTTAAKAALEAAGLKGEQVDTVIVGNVIAVSRLSRSWNKYPVYSNWKIYWEISLFHIWTISIDMGVLKQFLLLFKRRGLRTEINDLPT